ncbi:hypothetical protein J6590_018191 [Homalodisca vitripennis]|nr:hypothetical protein J6590_018191 [Homalodisca vitripennis]
MGVPMAERSKTLDFGSEFEITQITPLSVTVESFIHTICLRTGNRMRTRGQLMTSQSDSLTESRFLGTVTPRSRPLLIIETRLCNCNVWCYNVVSPVINVKAHTAAGHRIFNISLTMWQARTAPKLTDVSCKTPNLPGSESQSGHVYHGPDMYRQPPVFGVLGTARYTARNSVDRSRQLQRGSSTNMSTTATIILNYKFHYILRHNFSFAVFTDSQRRTFAISDRLSRTVSGKKREIFRPIFFLEMAVRVAIRKRSTVMGRKSVRARTWAFVPVPPFRAVPIAAGTRNGPCVILNPESALCNQLQIEALLLRCAEPFVFHSEYWTVDTAVTTMLEVNSLQSLSIRQMGSARLSSIINQLTVTTPMRVSRGLHGFIS